MMRVTLLVLLAVCAIASATKVFKCNKEGPYEDSNQVVVSDCNEPPCILKRRKVVAIEQSFVPDRNTDAIKTTVHAEIFGLPVPFIGVNGANACDHIYNVDGSKASCPLEKGRKYVYKSSFPIRDVYPRISLVVHWALTDSKGDIACFEVPSKITS